MKRIMIIENNILLAERMKSALVSQSYEAATIFSGMECIRQLGEFKSHLITLHVNMPDMNGIEVVERAIEGELTSGKGPMGVAASAIYIAAILTGERRTQREIAEITGVTEITIRNRYKEMRGKLKLEKEMKKARKNTEKIKANGGDG